MTIHSTGSQGPRIQTLLAPKGINGKAGECGKHQIAGRDPFWRIVMAPTKEQVHAWLKKQIVECKPPPAPEEIRRQLSWDLNNAAN